MPQKDEHIRNPKDSRKSESTFPRDENNGTQKRETRKNVRSDGVGDSVKQQRRDERNSQKR